MIFYIVIAIAHSIMSKKGKNVHLFCVKIVIVIIIVIIIVCNVYTFWIYEN